MKKQSGFTLIELLLVLAIIAVIAAIATPTLLGQRARARDKAAIANANALIADLVAGYDRCREASQQVDTVPRFVEHVLGTQAAPRVIGYWRAKNPWSGQNPAYGEVTPETTPQGDHTRSLSGPGTMGQVQVGYLPPQDGAQGCVVTAVYLNQQVDSDISGTLSHVYYNVSGLD